LGKDGEEQKDCSAAENTAANVPQIAEPRSPTNGSTDSQNDSKAEAVAVRDDARNVANTSRQLADMLDGK
jgi:DNA polymerase-3 subunit gamma/tau